MSSPAITIISLPQKFEDILVKNENALLLVRQVIKPYSVILKSNRMEFFPEYTDHSINHVEEVLKTAEMLIPDDIFVKLTPEDIGVMVISVALHDIGMQTSADMFKNMINGQYNDARVEEFDKDTWSKLWEDYKKGSLYWDSEKKENVFGNKNYEIKIPDLKDLQELNNYQKKFIGDFIRIYHCRIAHEIAKKGYIGKIHIENKCDVDFLTYLDLAGLVARSHGIDMRNTFDYLENYFDKDLWATPYNVHVIYLMALLRIADYLQIDKHRTNTTTLKAREMYSPYSRLEHETHLAIKRLDYKESKETIIVSAKPENARTHVKITDLVKDIQREFDQTWAVMGEAYGKDFTLNYRRIKPTFYNSKNIKYVPQKFSYRFNDSLAKLLVGPLYNDNPSFGVRELVQNAVDACRECKKKDKKDPPHVVVKLDTVNNLFTITDTGKGMTLEEIQKYFLTIGSSFNDNVDWKKWRDDNNTYRSGRFGIGVLAAFLLGDKICVETRSKDAKTGYSFEAELGDKFIEIKTNDKLPLGTTIKIVCNTACVNQFKKEAELKNKYYGTSDWYGWYIDKDPKVSYFCDGTQIKPRRDRLKGFIELDFHSDEFGEICWKPWYSGHSTLYCNGFFISDHANHDFFPYNTRKYGILYFPNLQITDKCNSLPINLKRTNIDRNVKYAFEDQLTIEVFNDTICRLMAQRSFPHISKLLPSELIAYHKFGYILHNEYSRRFLSSMNMKVIYLDFGFRCDDEFIKSILNMNKYSNYIFTWDNYIYHNEIKKTSVCYSNKFLDDHYISPEIDFNMFDKKRRYKGFIIQALDKSELNLFDTIIDYLSNTMPKDLSIGMGVSEIEKDKLIFDKDLENIFKHYFGENIFIPYDINERKEKYPEIYNDEILAKKIEEYVSLDLKKITHLEIFNL